jgi:hypothetical protein
MNLGIGSGLSLCWMALPSCLCFYAGADSPKIRSFYREHQKNHY